MTRSHAAQSLLIAALATFPAASGAQACLGNASFGTGHLQLAGDAQFAERATSFGVSIGSGSESVFANVGVGGVTYDDVEGSTLLVGGTLGYQVTASAGGNAQMCPVFSAAYGMGPNDFGGSGSDLTVKNFSFGLALGGEMGRGGELVLVPAVSLAFVYSSASVDIPFGTRLVGGTISGDDTYGLVGLTVGMVLNSQLSIRPSVSVPFGVDESNPIFGIGVTLNYGGRR